MDEDLLPSVLSRLSTQQLHRLARTCRAFRAGLSAALSLRQAMRPSSLRTMNASSSPPCCFKTPTHLLPLPDGGLVVADSDNNRVKHFNAQGALRLTIDEHEGERLFRNPRGLATDGEHLFVADSSHHAIRKLRLSDGQPVDRVGVQGGGRGEFSHPEGLALGAGRLFVADKDNNRIVALKPETLVWLFDMGSFGHGREELMYPTSLTVLGGEVFVADHYNHRLQVFAAHDGAWLRSIRGFGKWAGPGRLAFPYGLGADAKGRLLVTETKRVIVLTPQGEQVQSLPLPECGALSGIDGGPSHVYVADSSNEQVLVYDTVL